MGAQLRPMRTLHISSFRPIIPEKGIQFSSIQFSQSAMSDSLQPHRVQHARLPCHSPTPRAYSNSCPLSRWCHPTISSSVIPFFSHFQTFPASILSQWSTLHIRWPKYWSFSFGFSPSNEYSELISFRMDWLDLLAVQGTLKSLLQQHNSKASILQCSACFIVQLSISSRSHPYMTTGKTIALTRRIFVDKLMSLLFNMLSRALGPSRRSWGCLAKENHIMSFRAPHSITAFVQHCAQGQVRKCCTSLGALWSQGRAAVNIYMLQKFNSS